MKKIIFILLFNSIVFLNIFCQHAKQLIQKSIRHAKKNVSVSSLFSNIRFLPLETKRSSLIGEADKIRIMNNKIYLLDRYSATALFIFNVTNGEFEFKIEAKGVGPGEFSQIDDFSIDRNSNHIYILANARNVYKYDSHGKLIEKYDLGFPAHRFSIVNNNSFVFCGAAREPELIITDNKFKIIKKMFPYQHRRLGYMNTFSNMQGGTIYTRIYDCSFYTIEDFNIFKFFQLSINGTKDNTKIIKEALSKGSNYPVPAIYKDGVMIANPLFSNDLQLFFSNILHDDERYLLISSIRDKHTEIYDASSLKDDIIEEIPFYIYNYTMTDDNEVVFLLYPHSLIKRKKIISNKELCNVIENINDIANPILMFATIIEQ